MTDTLQVDVIGSGYAPLLSAIAINKRLPIKTTTKVFLSTSEPPQELCLAGSYFRDFHQWLEIKELDFLKATCADMTLATEIVTQRGSQYFSETPTGFMLKNTRFQHLFNYASNTEERYDQYNLGIALHKQGRFTPPSPNPQSLYHSLSYSYIFKSEAYTQFLYSLAEKQGIEIVLDRAPTESSENLQIFTEKNQSSWDTDYFSDLTRSDSYSRSNGSHGVTLAPFSHSISHQSEAQTRTYSKDDGNKLFGHQNEAAKPRRIFLGDAYAKLPSLLIDSIYALQSQLMRLCKLPNAGSSRVQAAIFNRNSASQIEGLAEVDEIILSYLFPDRPLSMQSKHRIQLFKSSGSISINENTPLNENAWLSLLYAIYGRPFGHPAAATATPKTEMNANLSKMQKAITEASTKPPLYSDFLHSLSIAK